MFALLQTGQLAHSCSPGRPGAKRQTCALLRPSFTRLPRPFVAPRGRPSRTAGLVVQAKLEVGSRLQDYPDYYRQLKRSDGGSVALSSFEGKSPVVVFFYPKACSFRDQFGRFTDAGVQVFGVSSDDPATNAKFAKEQRLPFPLLTDQSEFLRKSFGIKKDFGLLPGRQTFVIDKSGKVLLSFNDQLGAEKHVKEALAVLGL